MPAATAYARPPEGDNLTIHAGCKVSKVGRRKCVARAVALAGLDGDRAPRQRPCDDSEEAVATEVELDD